MSTCDPREPFSFAPCAFAVATVPAVTGTPVKRAIVDDNCLLEPLPAHVCLRGASVTPRIPRLYAEVNRNVWWQIRDSSISPVCF
jgi:hypothetical protein